MALFLNFGDKDMEAKRLKGFSIPPFTIVSRVQEPNLPTPS